MESITDLTCPFNNRNCIYECAFWDKREEFCKISEALSIYIQKNALNTQEKIKELTEKTNELNCLYSNDSILNYITQTATNYDNAIKAWQEYYNKKGLDF